MKAILDVVARHAAGEGVGVTSVCSAHPMVIEATLRHARRNGAPFALIEATSNQVNQFGGYTGMTPADFRAFVLAIADRVGLPSHRVLLGGDHLGPNAWQTEPADAAMAHAEQLIEDYVEAGFRKIHLDCSMSCADDPRPLTDEVVAERAARLCAVAERTFARVGGEPPVYVIGTEVPVPGGAHETIEGLAVTSEAAAAATLAIHRAVFEREGLSGAWFRVVALVVQPGVEFDHDKVIVYDPDKARELSALPALGRGMVFEAHSTDYQPPTALAALVRDHFAILKVGPGVTFALREALWALDAIEREWIEEPDAARLREVTLSTMAADPRYWRDYYHQAGRRLDVQMQYSLSDRIRYYWPDEVVETARQCLVANLTADPPPQTLIRQYLPLAFSRLRDQGEPMTPHNLIMEHISVVLDDYRAACTPAKEKS